MRKVFVLENGGAQKKLSFEIDETQVKTLGDLIPIINEKGINTTDKAFYESKSRSQLIDNESVLPENTNDNGKLILMVTPAQKKISNGVLDGAKRPEINAYVRQHNLADAIKDRFGKSWTNVPSVDIVAFINENIEDVKPAPRVADAIWDNAVAYAQDCEDDDVRAYLLDVLGASDSDSDDKELASMNVEDLFDWTR